MGVLNVTPDSFSDGGRFVDVRSAIAHAHQMVEEGAAIIDIGGESTRPGAAPVSADEELERIIPVIEALVSDISVPLSVDTSKPDVMTAAVAAGAGMINDVCALHQDGALDAASACKVPVCVMHMQGEPRSMQENPQYVDVVDEVTTFLKDRAGQCKQAGIENVVIDPGFGFGKSLQHNLELMKNLPDLVATGYPVMVGVSRKSMFGQMLARPAEQRLAASVACAGLAAWLGARIIRAHDVAQSCDAIRVCYAASRGKSFRL